MWWQLFNMEDPIIKDDFKIYGQINSICSVKLTNQVILYTQNNLNFDKPIIESISIKDIIGCVCLKSGCNDDNRAAYFTVYSYSIQGSSKKERRKKKTITFEVYKHESFEKNLEVAKKWKLSIFSVLYSPLNKKVCDSASPVEVAVDQSFGAPVPLFKFKKKFLILINPRSGPGLAYKIYKKSVKPLLYEADIPYDLVVTTHSKHAYKLVQSKDLNQYSGIVIISGDGLLFEVYNGLLQRSDCQSAISIPIGMIPGGSGNGLARSISFAISEPYMSNPVLASALNIVNPIASPMDLVLINTRSGNNMVSFLSIGYGIMSAIDIESERLRAIGEARFTVYGLAKIFSLKKHRVRLSYKVADSIVRSRKSSTLNNSSLISRSHSVAMDSVHEKLTPLTLRSNSVTFEDETEDISTIEIGVEANLLLVDENRSCIEKKHILDKERNSLSTINTSILESSSVGIFDSDVPSDWVTIEDEFVSIYAVTQPFISSTNFMSPNSTKDDGIMWLCYLKGNVSKTTVFKYLIGIDDGTHINLPDVHYIPVSGLRFDPLDSTGKLTVDGELIELEPIHATVLPSKGKVMTRRS